MRNNTQISHFTKLIQAYNKLQTGKINPHLTFYKMKMIAKRKLTVKPYFTSSIESRLD